MELRDEFISADAFWKLIQQPEYAEKTVELVDGEIMEMPKPGIKHGFVTMTFAYFIKHFSDQHELGYVFAAETGFILKRNPDGRDTVRGIDIAFVSFERLPDGLPDGHCPVAPDLAVEVISPGNNADDIHTKVLELLAAGAQIVCVVYPLTQTMVVHTVEGSKTLTLDDTFYGGDVLPGFELKVAEIFS